MKINIKTTNIELTNPIKKYVNKRLDGIKKFIKKEEIVGHIEIGKTTQHHKQGDIFKAEFDLNISGQKFYTVSEKEDLYLAIDDAKEDMVRMIVSAKKKKQTLYKRGALSVKKMMKGITKRNPFTSKY